MSILYNGSVDPDIIMYNNISLDKVIYNGNVVWEAYREITPWHPQNNIPENTQAKENLQLRSAYFQSSGGDHLASPHTADDAIAQINSGGCSTYDDLNNSGNYCFYDSSPYYAMPEINITPYRKCICKMSRYLYGDYLIVGTTANHLFFFVTFMNELEQINANGGYENWIPKSQGSNEYWFNSETIKFSTSDPTGTYHIPNSEPTNYPWSYVCWCPQIGFLFHKWNSNGIIGNDIKGPLKYNYNALTDPDTAYSSDIIFSVEGLTGNRKPRIIQMPYSTNGVGKDPSQYLYIYFYKITLTTERCEYDTSLG